MICVTNRNFWQTCQLGNKHPLLRDIAGHLMAYPELAHTEFIRKCTFERQFAIEALRLEGNVINKQAVRGIFMALVVVGIQNTLEDPSVKRDLGHWRLFGQSDYVEHYAPDDYVNKIRSHGFRVEELRERYFGKEVFRSLGLKRTSTLYVVSK